MSTQVRIIVYRWVEGVLKFEEHVVESIEHAFEFLERLVDFHEAKVYDDHGVLVKNHSCSNRDADDDNTYA